MIESASIRKNKFIITTNNQELIDYLVSFEILPHLVQVYDDIPHSLSLDDYYTAYRDRYSLLKIPQKEKEVIFFVEDELAKLFIERAIPGSIVIIADGAGNLINIEKSLKTITKINLLKDFKIVIMYDKDQIERDKKYLPHIKFLPFQNVEQEVIDMVHNNSCFVKRYPEQTRKNLITICKNMELHNAYTEILRELKIDNLCVINCLVDLYKKEINELNIFLDD